LTVILWILMTSGAQADSDSVLILRAEPDPAHRARIAAWWDHYQTARPALARVVSELRRERARWRSAATPEGCRRAQRALAEIDRRALLSQGDYGLAVSVGEALDEFGGAAAACLERRYFEFDYRLRVAEAALSRARQKAVADLGR
jgi:hypothetical protein